MAARGGLTVTANNPAPADGASVLVRLQNDFEAQTKRIDLLYRVTGPLLDELEKRAASLEKQQREDKARTMECIRKVEDESLTGMGRMNPAAAEFGGFQDPR